MILKHASAVLDVITSTAATINVHVDYMDLVDAATTGTPAPVNTNIASATTTTIMTGVGTTTARRALFISFRNTHATLSDDLTLRHYDGTSVTSEIIKFTIAAGETRTFNGDSFSVPDVSRTYVLGSSSVFALTGDISNSTVTPAALTTMTASSIPAGTYLIEYFILHQSSITTTGVKFDVNFTGTVTHIVWDEEYVDNTATASTAAADQDAIAATAQVLGAFASRAKGTAGRGTTISVDTANADMFITIRGMMIVTVSGNLELWHGSETAAQTTVLQGTSLRLTRTA